MSLLLPFFKELLSRLTFFGFNSNAVNAYRNNPHEQKFFEVLDDFKNCTRSK